MGVSRSWVEAALGAAFTLSSAAVVVRGVVPSTPTAPQSQPLVHVSSEGPRRDPAEPSSAPLAPAAERIGSEFDSDAAMPSHAESVADYVLTAKLDTDAHVVRASGSLTWTNRSRASVSELFVHAYLNAFKSDDSTFLSRRAAGGRGTGRLQHPGQLVVHNFSIREMGGQNLWPSARNADETNAKDETDLSIGLPRAIGPGETVHIELAFDSHLPQVVERTGYVGSFHMVGQWFPKIARLEPDGTFAHFPYRHLAEYYADFGDYDVTIDVPTGFEVGATGLRVSDEQQGARRMMRYVQRDVHDFAFAAYDGFRVTAREANGVTIRLLAPDGYESVGEQELDAAVFGLQSYGRRYGAYPYKTLTIVHPPPGAEEAGGMEYPTLITTGGLWYAFSQAGYARSLTLHELGHQYFYGLVASDEATWPFLDEGLATYAEFEALDEGWGQASLWSVAWSRGGTDGLLRYTGLAAGHDDVIAQPADAFVSGQTYGLLAYARAALVFRTLDRAYERGAMDRTLGRWARRYRFDHPGPSHLLAAVRDTMGDDAQRQLATALSERGWVDYAVADARCSASPDCRIVVTRRGTLVFPVDIDVRSTDGSIKRIRWDGAGTQVSLAVSDLTNIASVVIDPEHRILLDDDLANNAMRTDRASRAWRVWDRATYGLSLATHLVTP